MLFLSDYSVFEPQRLDLFSLTIHVGVDGAKKANCSYSWRESHQNADHD